MSRATRVVYDCNVFLQALASPQGPAGACVQLVIDGKVELFVSPFVIDELREVANRPSVVNKLRLHPERVEAFVEMTEIMATLLDNFPEKFLYDRDLDDARYINLALAAGASVVVSRDKDLLDLMDDSVPIGAHFQRRFPLLDIFTPVQFLQHIAMPNR